ncbi:MAG: prepilin peptidase [Roseibium sp.]
MIEAAILVVFPMLVAFGGASDLLTMTIRNRVSVLLIFGFCLLAFAVGLSLQDWGYHLLGLVVVFVPCFAFFAFGWMGGGDVKMISAVALWFGYSQTLIEFLFVLAVYGMLLTLGILFVRYSIAAPAFLARQEWFARLYDTKSGIPYGIAIALAALKTYSPDYWFGLVAS